MSQFRVAYVRIPVANFIPTSFPRHQRNRPDFLFVCDHQQQAALSEKGFFCSLLVCKFSANDQADVTPMIRSTANNKISSK